MPGLQQQDRQKAGKDAAGHGHGHVVTGQLERSEDTELHDDLRGSGADRVEHPNYPRETYALLAIRQGQSNQIPL
ncbi:hypothetical protein GCM10029992_37130 [Glycomyces albus]